MRAETHLDLCGSLIGSKAPQPVHYLVWIRICHVAGAHPGCDAAAYCDNPHRLSCSIQDTSSVKKVGHAQTGVAHILNCRYQPCSLVLPGADMYGHPGGARDGEMTLRRLVVLTDAPGPVHCEGDLGDSSRVSPTLHELPEYALHACWLAPVPRGLFQHLW